MLATMPIMGRQRKKTGGAHKTQRVAVQFPAAWITIARKMASTKRMPHMWYILSLIEEAAKAEGVTDFPPRPWEEE